MLTDKEQAVMNELWATVNPLRWQSALRLKEIARYRAWLPQCEDSATRHYYNKWLDFFLEETRQDTEDEAQKLRVKSLVIERPPK